jgi:hypothetical protein
MLGTAAQYAGPMSAAWAAGKFGATHSGREVGKLGGLVKAKKDQEAVGGVLSGALTGFLTSGFNPIGALGGAIFGGVSSRNKCVIVSACTDPEHPELVYEVDIARLYRDAFMDTDQLRGYYAIAEAAVPCIDAYRSVKWAVKKLLVDPLVEYGETELGLTTGKPSWYAKFISKAFLGLCKSIGSQMTVMVRSCGEVL